MSNFTKGKWKYLDNLYQVVSYPEDEHVFYDGNAPALWHNITGELNIGLNNSEEEAHANGRLIAAAPDMYELLYEALQELKGYDPIGNGISTIYPDIEELLARIDGDRQEVNS